MQWVGKSDWRAQRSFNATPEDLSDSRVIFTLTMADHLIQVLINSVEIGKCDNQFRDGVFDCTDAIQPGENTIELRFTSAEKRGLLLKPADFLIRPLFQLSSLFSSSKSHPQDPMPQRLGLGPCLLAIGVYERIQLDFITVVRLNPSRPKANLCRWLGTHRACPLPRLSGASMNCWCGFRSRRFRGKFR